MVDDLPKNGLLCSVCRQPQVITPSGATCENNHGGADGIGIGQESYFEADSVPEGGSHDDLFCADLLPDRPPPPVRPSSEVMVDLLALVRKHWPNETSVVQKAMTADMYWIALKKGEA